MMRLALALLLLALPAHAEEGSRATLGVGRLFSNDFLGDGRDRWRTGSYSLSVVRGPGWDGAPPERPGELLEWRFRGEIIAPRNLYGEGSDDRPYAGALTFGLHTAWRMGGAEVAAGADLTATGPSAGVLEAMDHFHELVSSPNPSDAVRDGQIGDAIYPSGTIEVARPFAVSPTLTLRPFAGAEAGVEEIGRIGLDVVWGGVGQRDLWIRDVPSGQLYRGIEGPATGFALVAGGDWAAVGGSRWLPDPSEAKDQRLRARAGIHWQIAQGASAFYGLSYLSPEFEGQPEGQVTGQVKLNFNF